MTIGNSTLGLVHGTREGYTTLLGRALIGTQLRVVSFDARIAWQIAVTFDLATVTSVAGLGVPDLSPVPDYSIYLFLGHFNPAIGGGVETGIVWRVTGAVVGSGTVPTVHDGRTTVSGRRKDPEGYGG